MIDPPANASISSTSTSDHPFPAAGVRAAPLVVWLVIQLIALALPGARVPLWARAPQPLEQTTAAQVAAVQVIAAGMLFAWLLPNLATWAAVVLTGIPMLLLAGMLSETPTPRLLGAAVLVSAWLMMLGIWSAALARGRLALLGMAIASLWAVGMPIARYLSEEFHPSPTQSSPRWLSVDPSSGVVTQIQTGSWDAALWGVLALVALGGAAVWAGGLRSTKSTAYPQP